MARAKLIGIADALDDAYGADVEALALYHGCAYLDLSDGVRNAALAAV